MTGFDWGLVSLIPPKIQPQTTRTFFEKPVRAGIFVDRQPPINQAPFRSDIFGNTDGICRPAGADIYFGLFLQICRPDGAWDGRAGNPLPADRLQRVRSPERLTNAGWSARNPGKIAATSAIQVICIVDCHQQFEALLTGPAPVFALAPMQEVTDLPFWKLMAAYGGADVYVTEYFRVYATSHLIKRILKSITENPTGRPVIAQMIGNDIPSLVRTARELQHYPIAAVDLNLGCPAPVVYRKCAGGGLLREPRQVDAILGALRDAVQMKFTVKTRIRFDSPEVFVKTS